MPLRKFFVSFLLSSSLLCLNQKAYASPPWLHTEKNAILTTNGGVWVGHGANVMDAGSNRGCYGNAGINTNPNRAIKIMSSLVSQWGANFIRIPMDGAANSNTVSSITQDSNYWGGIKRMIDYVEGRGDTYVVLAPWHDPSIPELTGVPTVATDAMYNQIVDAFHSYSSVIIGLCNEPTYNTTDADSKAAMEHAVSTIRSREAFYRSPQHIISVPGRHYAQDVNYYVDHPITSNGGTNIVYEVHIYEYNNLDSLVKNKKSIPIIVGEYGPSYRADSSPYAAIGNPNDWQLCVNPNKAVTQFLALEQVSKAIDVFRSNEVSYAAWSMSDRAPPNLLLDTSNPACPYTCREGDAIPPTSSFGDIVRRDLAMPYINKKTRLAVQSLLN